MSKTKDEKTDKVPRNLNLPFHTHEFDEHPSGRIQCRTCGAPAPVEDLAGRNTNNFSFAAQVSALDVGESTIKNSQVNLCDLPATYVHGMSDMREVLRNSITSAKRAAVERTGGTYSVELNDLFMPSGRLFVVAVVTRTA